MTPDHWQTAGREPTVRDVLADPIVRMLARSDGLSEDEIEAAIRTARAREVAHEPAAA